MSASPKDQLHHIVIVGGGAGGLELATQLGNTLGKAKKARITLVDASFTHIWKPLLHEVATGVLNSFADELNYVAHAHQHHFDFSLGCMESLDRGQQLIWLAPKRGENGEIVIPRRSIHYDTLVIAVGSVVNDFGNESVREHCYFLNNRDEADHFQQMFLQKCFQVQAQQEPIKPGQLDMAIIGAGATGVELAAELKYALKLLVDYGLDRIDPEKDVNITVIEAGKHILPVLPQKVSDPVLRTLESLGINVYTEEMVTEVNDHEVITKSGLRIPSAMTVWAAGIRAPDFLANIDGLETNQINQIMVKTTLQSTVDDNIFALGDCACCPQQDSDRPVPPRAQSAHQQASMLVKSMARRLRGKSLPKFVYKDHGTLISLSRFGAMGRLMGGWSGCYYVDGFMARMFYRGLYKLHQRSLHGTWRVMLQTAANFLTQRLRPRLKLH